MNLKQLKETFRTVSGRYDLVEDDSTDMVRVFFNAGSKYLDMNSEQSKTYGSHFEQLAIDEWKVDIPYCRAIKEVYVRSTSAAWKLEKKELEDMIYDYLSEDSITSGNPLYYSPVVTRKVPSNADLSSFSSYLTYLDTETGMSHLYNGIIILPPTEAALVVEVKGFYYSRELVHDTDENYWSVLYPLTLIRAALRELEIFNQNQTRIDRWDKSLAADTLAIERDAIEQEITDVDQIEN